MTSKKVLEVFKDYIAADDSCEVLHSSRGYLVVDWDSTADRWVTSRLCIVRSDALERQAHSRRQEQPSRHRAHNFHRADTYQQLHD